MRDVYFMNNDKLKLMKLKDGYEAKKEISAHIKSKLGTDMHMEQFVDYVRF
tara:strand:+ start:37 stop:189 length:153 start_codon:yes stop_codon:yes gene_type:complete